MDLFSLFFIYLLNCIIVQTKILLKLKNNLFLIFTMIGEVKVTISIKYININSKDQPMYGHLCPL